VNEREPEPTHHGGWLPVDVTLLDTVTGERRTYATWESLHGGEGFSDFIWTEGNYSCDCNRYLFFQYAIGACPEDVMDDAKCGDGRFRVESIISAADGTLLYGEDQ
jgi:hypothetical protein